MTVLGVIAYGEAKWRYKQYILSFILCSPFDHNFLFLFVRKDELARHISPSSPYCNFIEYPIYIFTIINRYYVDKETQRIVTLSNIRELVADNFIEFSFLSEFMCIWMCRLFCAGISIYIRSPLPPKKGLNGSVKALISNP